LSAKLGFLGYESSPLGVGLLPQNQLFEVGSHRIILGTVDRNNQW
jgi:hypothetical protein